MFLKNVNRSQTIRIQFLNIEEIPHFCKKKTLFKENFIPFKNLQKMLFYLYFTAPKTSNALIKLPKYSSQLYLTRF